MSDVEIERLLAHVATADTRWFKVSKALLDWGRRDVPEHRDSRNPVKWCAAQVGLYMDLAQTRHVNKRFDRAGGSR